MTELQGLCKLCFSNEIHAKNLCKPCYRKNYYLNNRDQILLAQKKWSVKHRNKTKLYARTIKSKFRNLKSSAKSRKLEFTIAENEYNLLIKNLCYYCDGYFSLPEAGGGLDRLDNNLGYHLSNVVPCCTICNQTRNNNWTPVETKIMIQAVLNFKKGIENV